MKKHDPYPTVHRNKNDKTISVAFFFGDGWHIPIKITAPYNTWLKWYDAFDTDRPSIRYELIEGYLSRPSKTAREALRNHSQTDPEEFAWNFRNYYILQSMRANPLVKTTDADLQEVRRVSKWIYNDLLQSSYPWEDAVNHTSFIISRSYQNIKVPKGMKRFYDNFIVDKSKKDQYDVVEFESIDCYPIYIKVRELLKKVIRC